MAFTDFFKQLDNICVSTFGVDALLRFQNGGELNFTGILAPPAMLEEVLPGQGASVVRFFCHLADIVPTPKQGDIVEINEIQYDVFSVDADNAGAGTLKMRKRGN